jgi:hypothetical protein
MHHCCGDNKKNAANLFASSGSELLFNFEIKESDAKRQ